MVERKLSILYIEPFDSGSHAQFTRVLQAAVPAEWTSLVLPGRHWKWRMRGAVLHWAKTRNSWFRHFDLIVASSYVPLAELLGLIPELASVPRILYFHENQLAYPAGQDEEKERDHHYGFTQMLSALTADCCVFNSTYNQTSFLNSGQNLLDRMPDFSMPDWSARVGARSCVLGVPLELSWLRDDNSSVISHNVENGNARPKSTATMASEAPAWVPRILWNHRWEHDKNPELFFAALRWLKSEHVPFRLLVCGQSFARTPRIFAEARTEFSEEIEHWGFASTRAEYLQILSTSNIVVSTTRHEFFGISMIEAAASGAIPLAPNSLSYPEIFPKENLYDDAEHLHQKLVYLCNARVDLGRRLVHEAPATSARAPDIDDTGAQSLLFLGSTPDAQTLRDRSSAPGAELSAGARSLLRFDVSVLGPKFADLFERVSGFQKRPQLW